MNPNLKHLSNDKETIHFRHSFSVSKERNSLEYGAQI